ncbi:TetR family transcriptional regulator [Kitasatospora sp. NPDC088351]|uniref:TetR/AcrR family transcriptional regulator n=1 Tax=unclassified Kitasatospora TaxID=2633591 RepID=UPI0034431B7C
MAETVDGVVVGAEAVVETGLRDRKKARTREAIRTAALDLFEEQGFERTTVDQICRRADVAHRTFFRYYPSKESLLFGWDFGRQIIDEFAAAPAALGLWEAFWHALTATGGRLEEPAEHTARRRLLRRRFLDVRSVHDHAILQVDTFVQRTIEAAAGRLGTDPDEDLRAHALGAALGAMTRRHIMVGSSEPWLPEAWEEAFRTLVPPGPGPRADG